MRMLYLSCRLAVFCAAMLALALMPAAARADTSLSVSPSLVEVAATPGGSGSLELVVSNQGSEPFPLRVDVAPYKDSTGNLSSVEWLQVQPTGFDLQPGQRRSVRVSIRIPENVDTGGRYAMVTFTTIPKAAQVSTTASGGQAAVSARIGIPILITLQGASQMRRQAAITRIVPVLAAKGRLGFHVVVANQGNVHVVPKGFIELSRDDGTSLGQTELPETSPVLPGSDVIMEARGQFDALSGRYAVRAVVDYGGTEPAMVETTFSLRTELVIDALGADDIPGKGPMLRMTLDNRGETALQPTVQMAVRAEDGQVLKAVTARPLPVLYPAQRQQVAVPYPDPLPAGDYTLVARVDYADAAPLIQETSFRIGHTEALASGLAWAQGPNRSRSEPTTASVGHSPRMGLSLPVLVALSLMLVGVAIRWRQRVRRALRVLRGLE